ncbi:MAG: acyl carrier protein [Clostridiales bacterium]
MFEKVRDVIVETLKCEISDITPEARLTEDLDIDSLDAVEMAMALEEALQVTIPDDVLADLKTIGDLVTYLENNA